MAGIDACIDLLQGPSDEKRFVGLLLVAKLLPAEDSGVALKIWEAIGPRLLRRMLVPITRAPQAHSPHPADESTDTYLMTCSVATAVLSSFTRFRNLAQDTTMLEFVPLLMQVWKSRRRVHEWAAGASEDVVSSILIDVLGAFVYISEASQIGRQKVTDHGGIEVAATTLQEWEGLKCEENFLAVKLLGSLLADRREEKLRDQGQVIGQAMDTIADLLDIHSAPENPDDGKKDKPVDPAVLQLEALRTLLMILPVPLPYAAGLQEHLQQTASKWGSKVRNGATVLLQSKATPVQRYSALKVTTAMVELCGPHWLVNVKQPSLASQQDIRLFQLVVEITKVELSILLHDALEENKPQSSESLMDVTKGACQSLQAGTSSADSLLQQPDTELQVQNNVEHISTCFWLLESILDVLAENEEMLDGESEHAHFDPLDDATATRAMSSVSECVSYILEYVSEASSSPPDHLNGDLLTACARCVGRFLADVPIGHKDLVMGCLEVFVTCGEAYDGAGFMVPGLLQLLGENDAEQSLTACSKPTILRAFFKRAGILAGSLTCQPEAHEAMPNPSTASGTSQEIELSATCRLLSTVLHRINEVPPAFEEMAMETWQALASWLLHRKNSTHSTNAQLAIALEVAVLLALVTKLFISFPKDHFQELELYKGCRAAVYTLEMGCKSVLGDEDAFRESCGDKWEELLTELIILIEDSHAQECFSQCIEAHPIFQQVCTGSNKDVELVSLHLFLKNLGFDITSQYLITN